MSEVFLSKSKDMVRAAKQMARVQGCVCDVEVEVIPAPDMPGVHTARIKHDDWCPLIRAREDRN